MRLLQLSMFISLLFVVLMPLSSAGFAVTPAVTSNALCPRDTALFTDTVVNTGTTPVEVTINLEGSASVWATAVPIGFTLAPNEKKIVYVWVTPPKQAVPGEYTFDLVVTGSGENKKAMHTITVKNCYGASVQGNVQSAQLCPGDVQKFDFMIQNKGQYADTFNLAVSGPLVNAVSLSDSVVTLDSGASKKVLAFVTAPATAGTYAFNVIAASKENNVVESYPASLDVKACYDFDVHVEKNVYEFCEHSVLRTPLRVLNKGTTDNTFALNLVGPVWARLEKQAVTVEPNSFVPVELLFAPDYGKAGDYAITVEVIPEKGTLKAVSTFDLKVKKCSSVAVDIQEETARLCSGVASHYDVTVLNNGEVPKEFKLAVDAPGWVTFKGQSPLTLQPQEQKSFRLLAEPAPDVSPGSHAVKVTATATDESGVAATDTDVLNIETVNIDACYKPVISIDTTAASLYFDSTKTIPITLKNEGITRADYNIVVTGSATGFVQVSPATAAVEPGRSEVVFAYVAPSGKVPLGTYEADVSVRLKDSTLLDTKTITLTVTNDASVIDAPVKPAEEKTEKKEETVSVWQKLKTMLYPWRLHILIAVIVFVVLVLLIVFRRWFKGFFSADFDEDDY